MRTEVWYPLICFAIFAGVVQMFVGALVALPGKASGWLIWGAALFSGALMLTSGSWATKTWIGDLIEKLVSSTPIIGLGLAVGFMLIIVAGLAAGVPDEWMAYSASTMLIVAMFLVPSLSTSVPIRGDIPDGLKTVADNATQFSVEFTDGWFS
ncbi:hypothetical protein [Kineosporia succinea]|uniref:Uncharacterized membrane protein YgdD (TMEM256/DUF423 family) n=1 Tax=Kineosporia succinea TaxID=84632 RepID=A0ABT9NXV5_9ACTN|nr:hypothetical protein [Kineosporia succinea]MDP9825258.1 uncharacterized membrane protein YgdD (TMEM256/DUF423 family) [Kineosporia succinea]